MSDHEPPPQVQHDKELRALYQERNAKSSFKVPMTHGPLHRHWYLQLFMVLVVVVTVSLLTTLSVITSFPPQVGQSPFERSLRMPLPAVEVSDDLRHRLSSAVVSFLPSRTGGSNVTQPYIARDSVGQGLVLSNDGWLVTLASVLTPSTRAYQVASTSGHLFPSELQLADPVAPLTFVKTSASNLTATPFVDAATLSVGQPVVVTVLGAQSSQPAFYLRRLAHLAIQVTHSVSDVSNSSEILPDRYLLDQALPVGSLGAPVTTVRGEVLGLVADYEGQLRAVVPLDNLGSIIDHLFADHQVSRPTLGITYVQSAVTSSFVTVAVPSDGVVVTAISKRSTVPGSANTGDLQIGDRIVAVAGERLTTRSLTSLLQQYQPGMQLDLTVDRKGRELKVTVTLGEVVSKPIASPKPKS